MTCRRKAAEPDQMRFLLMQRQIELSRVGAARSFCDGDRVNEIVIDWSEFKINSSTWKATLKVHKKRGTSGE
jgi:hypothetical protein